MTTSIDPEGESEPLSQPLIPRFTIRSMLVATIFVAVLMWMIRDFGDSPIAHGVLAGLVMIVGCFALYAILFLPTHLLSVAVHETSHSLRQSPSEPQLSNQTNPIKSTVSPTNDSVSPQEVGEIPQ